MMTLSQGVDILVRVEFLTRARERERKRGLLGNCCQQYRIMIALSKWFVFTIIID